MTIKKEDGVIELESPLITIALGVLCVELNELAKKHYELRAKETTPSVIRDKRIMTFDAIMGIMKFLHVLEGSTYGDLHRSLIPITDAMVELIETGNASELLVGEVHNRPPDRTVKLQLKAYCVITYNVLKDSGIPADNAFSQIKRIVEKENAAIKLNKKRTLDNWQTNCAKEAKWKEVHSNLLEHFERRLVDDLTPEVAKVLLAGFLQNCR